MLRVGLEVSQKALKSAPMNRRHLPRVHKRQKVLRPKAVRLRTRQAVRLKHTEAIRQVELKATTDDKLASVTVKGSDIIPADGSVKIKKITKKSENKTIEEKVY